MKIIKKDLLTVERGIIVHQVNCQGAMNSGVAKAIRDKWPEVYLEYLDVCNNYRNNKMKLLGEVSFVEVEDNLIVANLFGQFSYGYDGKRYTSYGAYEKALPFLEIHAKNTYKLPLFFPYKIGSDRGGANFEFIKELISEYCTDYTFCKL